MLGKKVVSSRPDVLIMLDVFFYTLRYRSVTGAVSGKTTYLVAGDMPGDSKIAKAKSLNVKIINEDEFLDLIRTQPEKTVVEPPPKKPTLAATKAAAAVSSSSTSSLFTNIQRQSSSSSSYSHPTNSKSSTPASTSARPISELWTEKYRPKSYNEIIGNKAHVDKLVIWLKKWDPQRAPAKSGAASKDDITQYKAVLISGPPGIGKTTTAHLVARLEGWDAIELNASDTRSKKAIEVGFTHLSKNYMY